MSREVVAIVGRPNVGKSTLFNKLAGAKISIVEDTPGVTRDRIYADVEWLKYDFTIIDTGGIEPTTDDKMLSYMRNQAEIAIDTANVIVFVVDVKSGLTDADYKVADMLRRAHKPVVLCVNKVDNRDKLQYDVYEFYNLGLGEPFAISSAQSTGIGDMLDEVVSHFDEDKGDSKDLDLPRIAVIGKPNVGKSSLINKLLGEERVIVSDIAGTTRDAVDTIVEYNGNEYIFVDTAGLRRKNKIEKEGLERYSIIRTVTAIDKSDIVVLLIDAVEGITEQDAKIAGIAHERGKGAIIAVNKWDAIEKDDKTMYKYLSNVDTTLSYMTYAPKIFISALTGLRINKLFENIDIVIQNHALRVSTGVLNDVLYDATAMNQPPSDKGRRLKLYYMTQISIKPPTFIIFVNDKSLMHFSYKRYIENRVRDSFGFRGTPIHFIIRERKEKGK
ncbi:ribosome biogenesis GTPase Der [Vallitalea sediminicola]